jgi:hypothetical protein
MIRVLVIDDAQQPEFLNDMRNTIQGGFGDEMVEIHHLNPNVSFLGVDHATELKSFLVEVDVQSADFWDAILVDINLVDIRVSAIARLQLSLDIVDHVRQVNKATSIIMYSGTLSDHMQNLLNARAEMPAESQMKKLLGNEIYSFVPRRVIKDEVYDAIGNPSWLLRVDRQLMKYSTYKVGHEGAEFQGLTFEALAKSVRSQSHEGRRVAERIAEFGVSSIVDLNI